MKNIFKLILKLASVLSVVIGLLFVVYFWNLDQKILGWCHVQVNKIFNRRKIDVRL